MVKVGFAGILPCYRVQVQNFGFRALGLYLGTNIQEERKPSASFVQIPEPHFAASEPIRL